MSIFSEAGQMPKIHYDAESQMWLASYGGLGFGAKSLQEVVDLWPLDWPR